MQHISILAPKYDCKFLKIDAEKSPFFVSKLMIKTLPTVIGFQDGVARPIRQIGFEGLTNHCMPGDEDSWGTIEVHYIRY